MLPAIEPHVFDEVSVYMTGANEAAWHRLRGFALEIEYKPNIQFRWGCKAVAGQIVLYNLTIINYTIDSMNKERATKVWQDYILPGRCFSNDVKRAVS